MSTYGIGREFSAGGWRDLIDQLLFEGLLREDPNDGRPLIGLGEADEVRAVYRGERRVVGAQDAGRRQRRRAAAPALAQAPRRRRARRWIAADAALFEALRAWRRERAAEQHVPPYVIFHDATLADIARRRPEDFR